jgi:sirohydrochlorin cobaltochelatase
MEEAPLVAAWAKLTSTPNVVVVPFFISDGLHSYEDIPVLLGIESAPGEVFRQNPHHLHGRALYYGSSIGTDARFAEIIVEQAKAFDREHSSLAGNFARGLIA